MPFLDHWPCEHRPMDFRYQGPRDHLGSASPTVRFLILCTLFSLVLDEMSSLVCKSAGQQESRQLLCMLLAPHPKTPTLCSKTVSLQSGDVSSPISSPRLAFLSLWLQGALCVCVFVYLCVCVSSLQRASVWIFFLLIRWFNFHRWGPYSSYQPPKNDSWEYFLPFFRVSCNSDGWFLCCAKAAWFDAISLI